LFSVEGTENNKKQALRVFVVKKYPIALDFFSENREVRSGFKTFNQVQGQDGPMDSNAPIKKIGTGIHICNISSIEFIGPTQELVCLGRVGPAGRF
jgi:hypothetical protein